MGSYVISVSVGTGCYRYIQISKSATLYKLHKAIINAFDFEDDHAHAFFMDNKYWSGYGAFSSIKMRGDERLTKNYKLAQIGLSKGDQFKYIFDFGDEWRFQCKVLRELDEQTDIPCVIRRVGESPEQYPEPDDEWTDGYIPDMDEDDVDETSRELLSREQIDQLYSQIPLDKKVIADIHKYMDAAARLYGLISLDKLYEIYNSQNPPVKEIPFLMTARVIDCEENPYAIIQWYDLPAKTPAENLAAAELVADYLLVDDAEINIRALRWEQKNKPYKILPKEEFLRYADPVYLPATPQREAMVNYLQRRAAALSMPAEDFCSCIQELIIVDAQLQDILDIVRPDGLTFDKHWAIGEFASLYQDLNNHTHKHANCGNTPAELFTMTDRGQKQVRENVPDEQISLFHENEQ